MRLTDDLRLGPPSRFPPGLLGTQVVVVDAQVKGIGWQGVNANFDRLLREIRLVLSPVLDVHLEQQRSSDAQGWVTEFDDRYLLVYRPSFRRPNMVRPPETVGR